MPSPNAPELKDRPANERILLTAHDLFYREGIRATGIDRVITESGVTKVTFYRHYPSKNELIRAFLAYRHERWMTWFIEALERHGAQRGKGIDALVPALRDWFADAGYRGCAFLNSVSELGGALPEVMEIARGHKRDMTAEIEKLLPPSRRRAKDAQLVALAVDGAIVHAQFDETPDAALKTLERLVKLLRSEA
jgi:AcrR family transcriptional regulator